MTGRWRLLLAARIVTVDTVIVHNIVEASYSTGMVRV